MTLPAFKLEQYLAQYEFSAPYLLCCSDAESWSMQEILDLASAEESMLWNNLRLGYTETHGMPLLRKTIAQTLYPGLSQDNILCFAGAEEAIFCALSTLVQPEDHVIVLTPCYQSLLEIPKLRGCSVTTLSLRAESQWRLDLEAIRQAITPSTKWLVLNFPHNPTGQVLTRDELQALIELLDHHGIWLFSDEVYRLLGPKKTSWALPAACLYPRALSLGVMSKAFGLAGLRVGWIACQDFKALEQIASTKNYTSICNSAPSEILSLITLSNAQHVLGRNNAILDHNLALLDGFMARHKDLFSWSRPQGGCVGFVRYHGEKNVDDFCKELRESKGVLLLPGHVYDAHEPYFRIGFGRKNMPQALALLENYLGEHE